MKGQAARSDDPVFSCKDGENGTTCEPKAEQTRRAGGWKGKATLQGGNPTGRSNRSDLKF